MYDGKGSILKKVTVGLTVLCVFYMISTSMQRPGVNEIVGKLHELDRLELMKLNELISGMTELNRDGIVSRDDKDDKGDKDEDVKQDTGPTKPLDIVGIRVAIAFGGILIVNFVAILVHHVYLKLSRSERSYRTIEHTVSPF